MAQITIAMPARNAAAFIAQAISSIQQQTDVDWELIVVDDASKDQTVSVVRAFDDSRIQLFTNSTPQGIGYCHNRVLAASQAPFITHVDADDCILPGALRKMITALENNPRAGQAHCQFYDVDEQGNILREVLAQRIRMYQRRVEKPIDYRRDLIAVGMVASGLRTYPRHVLEQLGGFNEQLAFGVDYEMAVRIAEHYEIAFVPEFLYVRRLHADNTTESLPYKRFRFFWQGYKICRALDRSRRVTYFHQEPYTLNRLLGLRFFDAVGILMARNFFRDQILVLPRRIRTEIRARIASPALRWLYQFAVNHGPGWSLRRTAPRPKPQSPARIGYYKWRFPTLSETFISREVGALRDAGVPVEMFADEPGDLDDAAEVQTTHYLGSRDPRRLGRAKHFFATKRRWRYWTAFLYITLHRYGEYKTWDEDRHVFERALELAYVLREHKVTHVHAPWADRPAFIALIAAYLLQIPYSVEARAHDLHRTKSQYGLREKFSNAQFIVTNSDYNAHAIRTYFDSPAHPPVHVIRELFPLSRFQAPVHKLTSSPFHVLCVARLIEEKGLLYLLRACVHLRSRGLTFRCEIIGAPEEPTYVAYLIQLMRLHKQLQLQDCVEFMGAQPFEEVLAAYARTDLFVLPCVIAENGGRDISPNSLIEAMAMGLPVVSTQLAAIPEIVEHGVSGILVPPNDAMALADAMEMLMRDEPRRRALGAQARERVSSRYDAQKNVLQFAALYRAEAG